MEWVNDVRNGNDLSIDRAAPVWIVDSIAINRIREFYFVGQLFWETEADFGARAVLFMTNELQNSEARK